MKKLRTFLTALAMIALANTVLADDPPIVNPYGKFLEGDGVEVEMAQFATKNKAGLNDVLLKITGANAFNAGIDGKTLKYQAVHGGTGVDYQFEGKTRMISRPRYGDSWPVFQVFLDGKTITLNEDKGRSKEIRPLHLLTASQSSDK